MYENIFMQLTAVHILFEITGNSLPMLRSCSAFADTSSAARPS